MKIPFLLGTTIALVCIVDAAVAQTPAEVKTIAQAVTVEINLSQAKSIGSGIIIHKQGDVYTVITNRHVVCGEKSSCSTTSATETFQLKFGNGSSLKVPASAIKILGKDIDLAIAQFNSNSNLQTAQIAPPGSLKVGDRVYTSGYPLEPRGYSFNIGEAIAVVNKRLNEDRGGYTVVYDAKTQPGMSGGGVFDRNGRIVAIHGQGERFRENTQLEEVSESGSTLIRNEVGSKIGYNRGIPVRWVVQSLAQQGIRLGDRDPVTPAPAAVSNTADEYFIAGFNKFVEPGSNVRFGKQQAIGTFSQAIRLNPRYAFAHFMRAYTYNQLQEYRLALTDYDRVIALNPNDAIAYYNRGLLKADKLKDYLGALADYNRAIALNPQSANAFNNRGLLNADKLKDYLGALADYDRAIAIAPDYAGAYSNRATLKQRNLKDYLGALADYDRAIAIAPDYAGAYSNRAILKQNKLKDAQGALADYDRAIALNPQSASTYTVRGILKQNDLKDYRGALADYDRAISINPKLARAYILRGFLKADKLINNPQGALADFDRAISLNPKFVNAYVPRGLLKYTKLKDRFGGIADMQKAAELAKAQGNTQLFNLAIEHLQSWGVR